MAKELELPANMAEDTRLAEACLLLNFPNQSYREQLMLFEQSKGSCSTDISGNKDNTKDSKDLLGISGQLPPATAHIADDRIPQESHSNHSAGQSNKNSVKRSNSDVTLKEKMQSASLTRATRDPITNLLAAVNCALPGIRTLPNILQRSSSNNLSPRSQPTAISSSLPEHDYCQRIQTFSDELNDCRTKVNDPPTEEEQRHSEAACKPTKALKLVAVHLGAGNGSGNPELLHFAKAICEKVMSSEVNTSECKILRRKRKQVCSPESVMGIDGRCKCQVAQTGEGRMTAEAAVVQLVKFMENNQALNCGYGSNLNLNGQVECDASLMSDQTNSWAGVGAVSGCKNPILLAKSLYDHRLIQRPLGLVQPNLLVGSGAKQWMREHCPHISVMDSKMLSSKSFSTYQKLKSSYDSSIRLYSEDSKRSICELVEPAQASSYSSVSISQPDCCHLTKSPLNSPVSLDHGFYCINRRETSLSGSANDLLSNQDTRYVCDEHICEKQEDINFELEHESSESRLDTVGAVAVDNDYNFACAISSGGLLLKYKGRIGQAAVPGAGCWSESSIATTTTGVGEYLTQNLFAKKFHEKIQTLRLLHDLGHVERRSDVSSLISCCMEECFEDILNTSSLDSIPHERKQAGALSVCSFNSRNSPSRSTDNSLYLTYAHNTNSMCIGYMTCEDTLGHSFTSLKRDDRKAGRPTVGTLKFVLN